MSALPECSLLSDSGKMGASASELVNEALKVLSFKISERDQLFSELKSRYCINMRWISLSKRSDVYIIKINKIMIK